MSADELMTKTIIRKLVEKILEDLIEICSGKNPEETNKKLTDYYIGLEQIRGYKNE